ncbi:MAG: polysaccharide deacetylase family protein [Lachnospiraceae bacterium]|nr:polysaccharide deacetylase family protein [Lachnospiraceae bacterium]
MRGNRKTFSRTFVIAGITSVMLLAMAGCKGEEKEKRGTTKNSDLSEAVQVTDAPDINLPDQQKISLGEILDLTAELCAGGQECQLTSGDESIVKILEDGSVFGVAQGEAVVTAVSGGATCQTSITVRKRGMVYPIFQMLEGEKLSLQFSSKLNPSDYTWSSNDETVAKVTEKGIITAKGIGSAVVTGTSNAGVYRCELTVVEKPDKVIYLTFDDGPNRYSTPKVLEILKKNDVKATFFELKPAQKDLDLTERILAEGHTLAIHGYKHKYDEIYVSVNAYRENLDKLRDLFFQKFGVWCTLTRFPGGSSNMVSCYNPGIMTKLTKKIDGWGYHYFDWNVSSGDAGGAKNEKDVFRNVKNQLSSSGANVVLMHDFDKNDKTINALDRVIRYGKKKGYTFLPLTASTEEVHHAVFN